MTDVLTSDESTLRDKLIQDLVEASKDLAAEARFQSASELMLLAAAVIKAYAGERVSLAAADVDALSLSLIQMDAIQSGLSLSPDVNLDWLKDGATYRMFVRAFLMHLASVGMSVGWHAPDTIPSVEPGQESSFYVAVRRAHNGQVYVFPAQYCNGVVLEHYCSFSEAGPDYEIRKSDKGLVQAFGWFHIVDEGEDEEIDIYYGICEPGDSVVGWHEPPAFTPPEPRPRSSDKRSKH